MLSENKLTAFAVPKISRQLLDQYFTTGQRVILEVVAEGNPTPEFKWEKDGLDIRPESQTRFVLAASALGRATLTIMSAEPDDAGLFSCIAHNRVGRDRTSALVYVDGANGRKPGRSVKTTSAVDRPPVPRSAALLTSSHAEGTITVIADLPKTLEVEEGEELRLMCVVKSDLHLIPTWSKAGRTLAFDGRRRITRNLSGEFCLTIDQAMSNDAGRYTLTIVPSDESVAETMEPVVLHTRVDVNPKTRKKTRIFERTDSQDSLRSTSSRSRRGSSYLMTYSSRETSYVKY